MKCPVCDKEHDTLPCPVCGFDASRDYSRFPTFGPLLRQEPNIGSMAAAVEHLYQLIAEWKKRLREQQNLEAESKRKDIRIAELQKELWETRVKLRHAEQELEALKAPLVEQDLELGDPCSIFHKYLSNN